MHSLTDEEQEFAKLIARRRGEMNREKKIYNRRMSTRDSDFEVDLQGIGAEMYFAKTFNLYPDFAVGHAPPYDAILPDGRTIDIKATKWKNGHLLAAPWKKKKELPDVYVLIVGQFPEYRIAGWMTADELLREERMSVGKMTGYVAGQEELSAIDSLYKTP